MNRYEAAALAVSCSNTAFTGSAINGSSIEESEEPPGKPRRHPKWDAVPQDQWDDWRWQMQNAIRTTSQLAEFFPYSSEELAALESLEHKYKLAIPPYYFSLIDVENPYDPIALQSSEATRSAMSLVSTFRA